MVRIRNLLILLTFAIIFSNCKSVELHKHYSNDDLFETSQDLILSEDGTFKFEIHEGFLHDTISGSWNILRKRELHLIPNKLYNHQIISHSDTCRDRLYIKTYNYPENDELILPSVAVYSKGKIIFDGFCKYLDKDVLQLTDSIKINYVGQVSYVYVPRFEGCVFAQFFLISQQQAQIQKNMIFRIKRKGLVGVSGKLNLTE